jgi:hypothetical protein
MAARAFFTARAASGGPAPDSTGAVKASGRRDNQACATSAPNDPPYTDATPPPSRAHIASSEASSASSDGTVG